MLKLTVKMRRFVDGLLLSNGLNFKAAALRAGYSQNSEDALAVQAHRLAHDSRIQAALQEETERRLKSGQLMASRVLLDIANNEGYSPSDRLKAASSILDRTGHSPVQKHQVEHKHVIDEEEAVAQITRLCGLMGLDPKKLLGNVPTIEGQAEDVSDVEEYTEKSEEGLEGLW